MNPLQLDFIPETDTQKSERFDEAIEEARGIVLYARNQKEIFDEHLSASIEDLEKCITRLQRKMVGLKAYLDTRLRLKRVESILLQK